MKKKYRELCRKEKGIPIFCRDWWLDAVCGEENWNVLLVEKNGKILAALPYYLSKGHFGLPNITMPKLTHYHGLWIKYPEKLDYTERLSFEKVVMYSVIEQLENLGVAYFSQHFPYTLTNWLPFFWKGFHQTTRYSYVIENVTDLEGAYARFEKKKRANIKKAGKILKVNFDLSPDEFYLHHKRALEKSGAVINYSYSMLHGLFEKTYSRHQGKSIFCEDAAGNIHGAKFIIWDENSAYQLIGSYDPDFRQSGVSSLLVLEALKYIASRTKQFDFVGSMVESYERPYRGFGGVQKQYFNISKTYSPLYIMREGYIRFMSGLRQNVKRW